MTWKPLQIAELIPRAITKNASSAVILSILINTGKAKAMAGLIEPERKKVDRRLFYFLPKLEKMIEFFHLEN